MNLPNSKYEELPCLYVAVGTAYEKIYQTTFIKSIPDSVKINGYMTLQNANKFIRENLPVRKYQYYTKKERPLLKDLLIKNDEKCIICVYGHYIYVDGTDYWSFFNNMDDKVVAVWYLKGV